MVRQVSLHGRGCFLSRERGLGAIQFITPLRGDCAPARIAVDLYARVLELGERESHRSRIIQLPTLIRDWTLIGRESHHVDVRRPARYQTIGPELHTRAHHSFGANHGILDRTSPHSVKATLQHRLDLFSQAACPVSQSADERPPNTDGLAKGPQRDTLTHDQRPNGCEASA